MTIIMNIGRRNFLYFISLGIYLFAKNIEISSVYHTIFWLPKALEVIRYVSYAMIIGISIFLTQYRYKVLWRYLVFMAFFLLISIKAKSVTILFNFMFIFAAKDIPLKHMIKYVITLQIIISTCIFMGCMIGLVEDWTYLIAGRFRHSMGYGYPNAIPTVYFYIMLAICYLMQNRLKLWHVVLFESFNLILFYYTNTRTAFALTAISVVALWALKFKKTPLVSCRKTRFLYVHSVYLIAVFAIIICYYYRATNPLLRTVDVFISNRLSMGHNALMINKLTLFGQRIQWYGFGGVGYTIDELAGEYNNVDCSYVKILLDHGIIMLTTAIIGYMYVANEELKKGNRYFCMALLFANLYALIEPRYIETGFNPFVWSLSSLLGNELYVAFKNRGGIRLRSRSLASKGSL